MKDRVNLTGIRNIVIEEALWAILAIAIGYFLNRRIEMSAAKIVIMAILLLSVIGRCHHILLLPFDLLLKPQKKTLIYKGGCITMRYDFVRTGYYCFFDLYDDEKRMKFLYPLSGIISNEFGTDRSIKFDAYYFRLSKILLGWDNIQVYKQENLNEETVRKKKALFRPGGSMRNALGLLICILLFIVLALISADYNYKYHIYCHEIQLDSVSCRVPESMWNENADDIKMNDHMFFIKDNESDYLIFGAQMEKYKPEECEEIINAENLSGLLEYDDLKQLETGIQNSCDALATVKSSRSIYSTDPKFIFDGIAGGNFEGYKSYVVAQSKGDVRFLQILLYRDPAILRGQERKEMYQRLRIE